MSITIQVIHGSDRHFIQVEDPELTTISEFKGTLHEKTGIPPDYQKLIFKGRTLQKNDQLVGEAGIKDNSKVMLLGRKVDPAQDEYLKQIQEISAGIDTLEKKIKKIEQDLDGIEKGFLLPELVDESCEKLQKQCLVCNENLMRNLETLDSVVPPGSETLVRGKRKTLVTRVQFLMNQSDLLCGRIQTCLKKSS